MRRAPAWGRFSTETECETRRAPLTLLSCPARLAVHAERRQVALAPVGLLLFHAVHLAALVEARFVGPDPPANGEPEGHGELPEVAEEIPVPGADGPDVEYVQGDDHEAAGDEQHANLHATHARRRGGREI